MNNCSEFNSWINFMIIQIASSSRIFVTLIKIETFHFHEQLAVICNFNQVFCLIHESFGEIFATVITIEFKGFFLNNFYVHFQIFATLITIESLSSWTAVRCSFNPIFCMKFLHTHPSCIFSNPLWTFSISTLKIYFLLIYFYKFYIWIL